MLKEHPGRYERVLSFIHSEWDGCCKHTKSKNWTSPAALDPLQNKTHPCSHRKQSLPTQQRSKTKSILTFDCLLNELNKFHLNSLMSFRVSPDAHHISKCPSDPWASISVVDLFMNYEFSSVYVCFCPTFSMAELTSMLFGSSAPLCRCSSRTMRI